jgi:phosphate/sulfate permease
MFKIPLFISTILLAMAHGSNEVNVSAPCAAQLFLLNDNKQAIASMSDPEIFEGMLIGLVSLLFGFMTLGKLFLNKNRKHFMKTSLVK